jgi:hypothetical protein
MSYGIPEELTYESLSRLFPSVKSEYRKNPINGGNPFTSGDIQMRINKMPRSFLNPATLCLNFRVRHGFANGTANNKAAGSESVSILGNALSYFAQQVVKPVSGQWQDTISYPGLISNTIMNMMKISCPLGSAHIQNCAYYMCSWFLMFVLRYSRYAFICSIA